MAPTAGAEEEAAGRDAPGRSFTFKLDDEFAAQDIERLILTIMGMRRCTGARRDLGFQSEKDPAVSAAVAF